MSRLPFKERSPQPISVVKNKFQAYILDIASRFLKSDGFKNASGKGTEREIPVQQFLRENIPGKYKVVKGEAIDLNEVHSPQLDVMIFDAQRNFAFYSGNNYILPAEALLVSVEVKSLLTKTELVKSLKAAQDLKRLRPFRNELALPRERGKEADKKCRYFHCLFAYHTDISEKNWLEKESMRISAVSESLEIPMSVLDRLYVANRGFLNLPFRRGITEKANSGKGLMHFYMHILNFLIRENKRRKQAPYIDYLGRLTEGWIEL